MINRTFIMVSVLILAMTGLSAAQTGERTEAPFDSIVDRALDEVEETEDVMTQETELETSAADDLATQPPSAQVEVLDDIVIDENSPDIVSLETKVVPLVHAEASGILDALEDLKSIDGEVLYNEQDRTLILKDTKEHLELMTAYIEEVDIPLETEVFPLRFINADQLIGNIKKLLTKNVGQVQFDKRANSIIVTDTSMVMEKVRELVAQADVLNKEIRIETKILQIVLNDEHIDGIDWEAIVSEYQSIPFVGFQRVTDGTSDHNMELGSVTHEDYEILLEALDTVGVVSNVSDEILTTENEGTQTVSIASSLLKELERPQNDPGKNRDNDREQVDLHLTPVAQRGEQILVTITPELKNGPMAQEHTESAAIQIQDGETIVIGSLFKDVMMESSWKIPLLGDLPLLGFVFRNQGEEPRKSEIIVFVTVKTVSKTKKDG